MSATAISAVTARKKFGELLDRVYYKKETFIIERAGKSVAVMIPLTQYQNFQSTELGTTSLPDVQNAKSI